MFHVHTYLPFRNVCADPGSHINLCTIYAHRYACMRPAHISCLHRECLQKHADTMHFCRRMTLYSSLEEWQGSCIYCILTNQWQSLLAGCSWYNIRLLAAVTHNAGVLRNNSNVKEPEDQLYHSNSWKRTGAVWWLVIRIVSLLYAVMQHRLLPFYELKKLGRYGVRGDQQWTSYKKKESRRWKTKGHRQRNNPVQNLWCQRNA